jgi:hypothetical protein
MNGQVKCANSMILQGLKPRIFNRLNKFGRRWVVELPMVLWSLRITLSRVIGFMPFFMVYGSEAILPTNLEYGTPRVRAYDEKREPNFPCGRRGQAGGSTRHHPTPLHQKLASLTPVLPSPSAGSSVQRRGSSASPQTGQQRPPQANNTMGGPIRHRRSTLTQHLQAGHLKW